MKEMIESAGLNLCKTAKDWNVYWKIGQAEQMRRANDCFIEKWALLREMGFHVSLETDQDGLATAVIINGRHFDVSSCRTDKTLRVMEQKPDEHLVRVIRCRDCAYGRMNEVGRLACYLVCEKDGCYPCVFSTVPDNYCSYAEERGENSDG